MGERSIAEFLSAMDQQAMEDDEEERSLLDAVVALGTMSAKVVKNAARTVIDQSSQMPAAETRPRFCRHCGTQLKPEGRFCTKCGATIVS